MGSSSSKSAATSATSRTVQEVRKQDPTISPDAIKACEAAIHDMLDEQLDAMKEEVKEVDEIITDDVISTIKSIEDSLLLQYEQLRDMSTIETNIRQVFKGFPALDVLVDAATSMIAAMKNTDELKKMFRWQQRKIIQRVAGKGGKPDKVVGLELHYKVKIVEETEMAGAVQRVWGKLTRSPPKDDKKTIVMVAYKCIAKTMDLDPDDYLDKNELDDLKF